MTIAMLLANTVKAARLQARRGVAQLTLPEWISRELALGDWVMAFGGVAVLVVMFARLVRRPGARSCGDTGESFNAWEAFAVTDVILALAAVWRSRRSCSRRTQPTAGGAAGDGLADDARRASSRSSWSDPPSIWPPDVCPTACSTTAAAGPAPGSASWRPSALVGGVLASMRDERRAAARAPGRAAPASTP